MNSLPVLTIVIADATPRWRDEIAKSVQAAIDEASKDSSFLSTLPSPSLIACATHDELVAALLSSRRRSTIEPCLLITDRIGTKALREARRAWPRLPVMFHSGGAQHADVCDLFGAGLIDSFVKKGDTSRLHDDIGKLFSRYWASSTIRSMRHYIFNVCRDPSRKCYEDRISNKRRWINMFQIYSEVTHATPLGRHLEELWDEMLTETMTTAIGESPGR
jgi:DNA-binding NarL/FixJ family response regulator